MLKSLIRGKFIGSRSVNNHPEHFVNNQVLTVGIRPYAVGETILSPTTAKCFRGPLHTRPCGATLSKQERAGDSPSRRCGGRGAGSLA